MATTAKPRRKRKERTLAAAVAHPVRSKCLVILAEREASPAEIARDLDYDTSYISYHVTALKDADLVEETRSRPVRGATEHFYRAIEMPRIDVDVEQELDAGDRRVYAESVWSVVAATATQSLDAGVYLRRDNHHLTRFAFNVDEEGWKDAAAAYLELEQRIFEVQREAADRMAQSQEQPLRVVSFQALFEVPRIGRERPNYPSRPDA
jgi:DNA-binding transcriptional ArsR family regulator